MEQIRLARMERIAVTWFSFNLCCDKLFLVTETSATHVGHNELCPLIYLYVGQTSFRPRQLGIVSPGIFTPLRAWCSESS
jgi:hypothetical protein